MFHEFFRWLQEDLGATDEWSSWTDQFRGSLNLWGLTEGTHVLTLMVFAGTIWLIDLRMLGVAFRTTPFGRLNDRVLPYTVVAFAVLIVTGIVLFLAKPMDYYHNVWFRAKMVLLALAAANIFWFHHKLQKNQDEWDTIPRPVQPALSGALRPYFALAGAVLAILGLILLFTDPGASTGAGWVVGKLAFIAVAAGHVVWFLMLARKAGTNPVTDGLSDKQKRFALASFGGLAAIAVILAFLPAGALSGGVLLLIKAVVAVAAIASAFWLHHVRQPNPPLAVKLSGAISLTSWVFIIIFGRFIAYDWYNCGKPQPGFVNWFAECATYPTGIVSDDAEGGE